jgi:hypothetical protein
MLGMKAVPGIFEILSPKLTHLRASYPPDIDAIFFWILV